MPVSFWWIRRRHSQSINQPKHIYVVPCIASDSGAHNGGD